MSLPSHRPAVPDELPRLVRFVGGLLRACGSLRLAVGLMGLLGGVLAWATLVESLYGREAAKFGIYQTWWFAGLGWLLALNVFSAVLVRFPWQRRQVGFLVTHGGILVLLAGCLLGRWYGRQGQVPVFEGRATHTAYRDREAFELSVIELDARRQGAATASESIRVPFRSGPFNWRDYAGLSVFPWRLAARSQGVIYEKDGLRLEVLDYLSDSRRVGVPRIALSASRGDEGSDHAWPTEQLTLAVTPAEGTHAALLPMGMGQRAALADGRRVLFWMSGAQAETEAFLRALPEGEIGPLGQVVLCAQGQTFRFDVAHFREKPRQALGTTGLEVELGELNPWMLGVQLAIFRQGAPPQRMFLFAYLPYANQYDSRDGVYGAYWFDPAAAEKGAQNEVFGETALREAATARVEILQGHDQRLYYRQVEAGRVVAAAGWPAGRRGGAKLGGRIIAFAGSAQPLDLVLREFVAAPHPGWQIEPLPFQKDKRQPTPRAELRLTVDGLSSRFWLASRHSQAPDVEHQVRSPRRLVRVSLGFEPIDLGFQLYLRRFRQQLDPGSQQPGHYSSVVDFRTRPVDEGPARRTWADGAQASQPGAAPPAEQLPNNLPAEQADEDSPAGKPLEENVLITLNAPVDFRDPRTGRIYRFFQTSDASGPFRPGEPEYDELVGLAAARDEVYLTRFAVNYDPGRGLKYAGSALIVIGIGLVYGRRLRASRRRARRQ